MYFHKINILERDAISFMFKKKDSLFIATNNNFHRVGVCVISTSDVVLVSSELS